MGCRIEAKGWGEEIIFADHAEYAGKLLVFYKKGNKFSMHFHRNKKETWYVMKGRFKLRMINPENADVEEFTLDVGDKIDICVCKPHQLIALEDYSTMIEVSMPDDPNDNYRVEPGDSQK